MLFKKIPMIKTSVMIYENLHKTVMPTLWPWNTVPPWTIQFGVCWVVLGAERHASASQLEKSVKQGKRRRREEERDREEREIERRERRGQGRRGGSKALSLSLSPSLPLLTPPSHFVPFSLSFSPSLASSSYGAMLAWARNTILYY